MQAYANRQALVSPQLIPRVAYRHRRTSLGMAVCCHGYLQCADATAATGAAIASQFAEVFVGAKTAFPTAGAGTGIGGLAASPVGLETLGTAGLETGATLAEGLLNRRGGDQHARASLAVAGVGTENDALFSNGN